MSTVKNVLMVACGAISAKLDIPFEQAAEIIRDNEAVADTVLREQTDEALAIVEKLRDESTAPIALLVAACEGIHVGALS